MTGKALPYAALLLAVQPLAGCSDGETEQSPAKVETSAGAGADGPATAAETADAKLVLAFGDSLYAGYGLDASDSFPHDLEQALKRTGIAARVHNAGVSGDTSAAGRQRLSFTLDGLSRNPDLAIVGLGGNDMLRGLDPETTRDNLDAILAELRRRDIPVLLTGMLAAPNLGSDYGARFNAIYPALARKYGAGLDPFFLDGVVTERGLMQADGIHPTAEGVDVIVQRLAPKVAAELAS